MSLETARDDIFALFKTYWDAQTTILLTYIPVVEWQGLDTKATPPGDKPWARAKVLNNSSDQTAMGTVGNRVFTRYGLAVIEIFVPKRVDAGLLIADKLAIIGRDAFEGKQTSSGIWFRKVRTNEIGPGDQGFQTNVIAEFEYDDVK